jgi:hypothetical protein
MSEFIVPQLKNHQDLIDAIDAAHAAATLELAEVDAV